MTVGVVVLLLGILAGSCGATVLRAWAVRSVRRGQVEAVNVVRGVVLPSPYDPEWRPVDCGLSACKSKNSHAFRLGAVSVTGECDARSSCIHVGSALLQSSPDGSDLPYYSAVHLAYVERLAQESIEGICAAPRAYVAAAAAEPANELPPVPQYPDGDAGGVYMIEGHALPFPTDKDWRRTSIFDDGVQLRRSGVSLTCWESGAIYVGTDMLIGRGDAGKTYYGMINARIPAKPKPDTSAALTALVG